MVTFEPNEPVEVDEPRVEVASASGLPVGANRFELVVVDGAGNESSPAVVDVIVRDTSRPTAVLDVVDEQGTRIRPVVEQGAGFLLSGARSSDPGGEVVRYRFTWLRD